MTYKFGMRTALVVGASAMALAMASTAANAVVTPATIVDGSGNPMEEPAPIAEQAHNQMHEGQFYNGIRAYLGELEDIQTDSYHGYVTEEYFVSGTAAGEPYVTRILVRRPSNPAAFSGMALLETQHSAGAFQTWDHTRVGGMTDGHMYVGVNSAANTLGGPNGPQTHNAPRYAALGIGGGGDAANEIIAQVAAMLKLSNPLGEDWVPDFIVMTGASQTAGTAINYMTDAEGGNADPDNALPDGSLPVDALYAWDNSGFNLEDGALDPDNLGGPLADVPTIILATQSEFDGNYNAEDEAGKAPDSALYRLYQVPGAPHLGSREGYAQDPAACDLHPLSQFMDAALMYTPVPIMYHWLAHGTEPGHARVEFDENGYVRDDFGNAVGGVRSPQVEVPTVTFHTGNQGAGFLCGLSGYQTALSDEVLDGLYTGRGDYATQLRASAAELVEAGWFSPAFLYDVEREIANFGEPVDYDWLAEPFDWTAAEANMAAAMAEEEDED